MEPKSVVVESPRSFDIWTFEEMVFVHDKDNSTVPVGISKDKWDKALSSFNGNIMEAYESFEQEEAFVLVSDSYWNHYKTNSRHSYDYSNDAYCFGIVEVWESGDREKIVQDHVSSTGFLYDLNGTVVDCIVFSTVMDNDSYGYDLDMCLSFINDHPELFDLLDDDMPYYGNASQAIQVGMRVDINELDEVVKKYASDYEELSPEEYFTEKYFGEFRNF